MKDGRLFRGMLVLVSALCLGGCLSGAKPVQAAAAEQQVLEKASIAGLVADWFKGSHPDVILGRIIMTHTMDGKGRESRLKLVSLYRDMPTDKDISVAYAERYGFKICASVEEALTLGTEKLAVDGVILSTEWAPYPVSQTGQTMYPHRRLFEDTVEVFERSGRVVPVFIDKHIGDTWEDSKWIYDTAVRMGIPLMAGSSVPVFDRSPRIDVPRGAQLKEIVGVSYHTLDGYGFHGMEMVQCLAERREGGETGIKQVQCLTGDAVWEAAGRLYDRALLDAAVARLQRPMPEGKTLKDFVPEPVLFVMDYADGLRVNLFTLNGFVNEWAAAWRTKDGQLSATLFRADGRWPYMHFSCQLEGIEAMMLTGKPAWPVERTLMTSGALDALLISKKNGGRIVETPYLVFSYQSDWDWQPPTFPEYQ